MNEIKSVIAASRHQGPLDHTTDRSMTMATDDAQSVTGSLPIFVGEDGHAYIGADAAVALLQAIAATCRDLNDDPDCDLLALADTLDVEADNLDCRAIAHTTARTGEPRP